MANEYFFGLFKRTTKEEKPIFKFETKIEYKEPARPEPDLSKKPKDIIGYCFAFVCPDKHVSPPDIEKVNIDSFKERKACQTCGKLAKLAVVRRISEARWFVNNQSFDMKDVIIKYHGYWSNRGFRHIDVFMPPSDVMWTNREFVNFVESKSTKKRKNG